MVKTTTFFTWERIQMCANLIYKAMFIKGNVKLKRPVGGGNFFTESVKHPFMFKLFKMADLFKNEASVMMNNYIVRVTQNTGKKHRRNANVSVQMNINAGMLHYLRYYDASV